MPYGDAAFLVELPDLAAVIAYYRGILRPGGSGSPQPFPAGIVDVVPAARTVLVTFEPEVMPPSDVLDWLSKVIPDASPATSGGEVDIDVVYGGADLAATARLLGTTEADVVRRHSGSRWTAAFAGFAPGFVYLVTDHDRLHVPRRATPRTAVPAGSVGLAGEFSGIYPRSSPGGWQLIGTTAAVLWDSARPEPALIRPGDTVRFREA
jgi:KipI family sensor histidine kinase inhibitor